MTTTAATTTSSFYLPDINIAPGSTGFFQLTGHGASIRRCRGYLRRSSQVLRPPQEVKQDLNFSQNVGFCGYELIDAQVYESDVLPDLKDGFFADIDLPSADPRVQNKRLFAGQNVWPSPDVLPYSEFRTSVKTYYQSIMELCWMVMDLIAATLPYGLNVFDEWKVHEPACPLRFLHYPPTCACCRKDQTTRQLRTHGPRRRHVALARLTRRS